MKRHASKPLSNTCNARIVHANCIGKIDALDCYDPPGSAQALGMALKLSHQAVFAAVIHDGAAEPAYYIDGKRVHPLDAMRQFVERRNKWWLWENEYAMTRKVANG